MDLINKAFKNLSLKGVDKMKSDWNTMSPRLFLVIAEHAEMSFWLLLGPFLSGFSVKIANSDFSIFLW